MKLAFVTECDYTVLPENVQNANVVLFPFYTDKVVSYNKEIKGETGFFKRLSNSSRALQAAVIAGVDTDSYGIIRHSVAVCDGGKLLGISDMTVLRDDKKYSAGAALRVYDTKAGKIGVVVGDDGLSSDCVKALVLCGAELIVNIVDSLADSALIISARAKACEFGVPVAVCANKGAMLASINGEIAFCSPQKISVIEIKPERNFHLITVRRRGKRHKGENK